MLRFLAFIMIILGLFAMSLISSILGGKTEPCNGHYVLLAISIGVAFAIFVMTDKDSE